MRRGGGLEVNDCGAEGFTVRGGQSNAPVDTIWARARTSSHIRVNLFFLRGWGRSPSRIWFSSSFLELSWAYFWVHASSSSDTGHFLHQPSTDMESEASAWPVHQLAVCYASPPSKLLLTWCSKRFSGATCGLKDCTDCELAQISTCQQSNSNPILGAM